MSKVIFMLTATGIAIGSMYAVAMQNHASMPVMANHASMPAMPHKMG